MRFYGITMAGRFVNHTLPTVPLTFNIATDTGRFIYTEDDGLIWWGDGFSTPARWRSVSDGSTDDTGEAEDMYSDLLRTTVFLNGTWDEYTDSSINNVYINETQTNMTWDSVLFTYSYVAGSTLESNDLYDSAVSAPEVRYCMPSVWWVNTSGTATPQIYVTADGGIHWEAVDNNAFHMFGYPGTDLRMKIIVPSGDPITGFIRSWGLLYNKDLSVSCARQALTRYELTITTETTIYTEYTIGAVLVYLNGVMLQDETDYDATDGTSIDIHSPALVAGDVVTVISYTTLITTTGPVDHSPYIRHDGTVPYTANQPMNDHKFIELLPGDGGEWSKNSVNASQLHENGADTLNRHANLYNAAFSSIVATTGTGQMSLNSNKIIDVASPTTSYDAMNLTYADTYYTPITHPDLKSSGSIYGHVRISSELGILRIQTGA